MQNNPVSDRLHYMKTRDEKDPLSSLIGSGKENERQKLAELLAPFVIIDEDSKEFYFKDAFTQIDNNSLKIELLLAAAKARSLYFNEQDGLTAQDIIILSIMPEGSVKTTLRKLFSIEHKIKQKDKKYIMPSYRIEEIKNNLIK